MRTPEEEINRLEQVLLLLQKEIKELKYENTLLKSSLKILKEAHQESIHYG